MTEFERWIILAPVYILLAVPTIMLVYKLVKSETLEDVNKKLGIK